MTWYEAIIEILKTLFFEAYNFIFGNEIVKSFCIAFLIFIVIALIIAFILKKVRKVFKKYLFAVQNSVFEGYITESKLNKLKRDLDKVIDVSYDSICFYELESLKYISKEQIGMVKKHTNLI